MVVLFFTSLSTILFELALTRIFSIILWYDYAFMAISVAFFGLGIGSLLIHMQKGDGKLQPFQQRAVRPWRRLLLPTMTPATLTTKIIQYSMAYAVSVPVFIFIVTQIPPDTSYIYLFYFTSSIPFFFAGSIMALIFFAMPRQISKLYFADLIGASSAALLLDPLMLGLGAEPVLLLTSLLVAGSATIGVLLLMGGKKGDPYLQEQNSSAESSSLPTMEQGIVTQRLKISAAGLLAGLILLQIITSPTMIATAVGTDDLMEVRPGVNKGLYYQLNKPEKFDHLSTQWNSFSRIDVTKQLVYDAASSSDGNPRGPRELAMIIIDADAGTPIYQWDGSKSDILWVRQYMDYLPYEISRAEDVLVIGSGGGQDILTALAGGAKKVTAVEINPMIVSTVRGFGSQAGNVYDRSDVQLFIDDGRRFISSSSSKFDTITIKLVDTWAAQLAGGYALSENYLYTVEAFQQYLRHLDDGGMLVMIRWNFELPRLMPTVAESLAKETGKSMEDVSKHIIVVEDRPGLFFGRTDDSQTYYPVLVMVKSTPFTADQIDLVREKAERNHAEAIMLADTYIVSPYDRLFSNNGSDRYGEYISSEMAINPRIPTDDSPFFFARELVPKQMIILLGTVLAISAALSLMLIYHAKRGKKTTTFNNSGTTARTSGFVLFAICIGLGFMILEITFIQKFLLLLGTPIMALMVILFSILLSSGIGAYLSGRLFNNRPYRAVLVSIPVLAGIVLFYLFFLQGIIDSSITMQLPFRAALTFVILFPAGLLMGFQFPALIRMAFLSSGFRQSDNNTTLLWGINVIASIIGTVLAATLAMIIGFNGNLLVGLAMYLGAGGSALLAFLGDRKYANQSLALTKER